jgi:hypothetical protein
MAEEDSIPPLGRAPEYTTCFGKLRRQAAPHDEIRKKCKEAEVPYNSVRKHLLKGLSLDEAMEYVRTHRRGRRKPPQNKTDREFPETFHEYFVDSLRTALFRDDDPTLRKEPLYGRKKKEKSGEPSGEETP